MATVTVVVLGDIGRSPRMQYHCLSLANEGFDVNVIGYSGASPLAKLTDHPNVTFRYMKPCPDFIKYAPKLIQYILKMIWLCAALFFKLITMWPSKFVLVQNPPAVPTFGVCYVYCRVVRSKLVIDWHNYGFSILSLTNNRNSKLVKFYKFYEMFFGRLSDANICVTKAMRNDLKVNHKIDAVVMHDKPAEHFREMGDVEKHHFFKILAGNYGYQCFEHDSLHNSDETRFTKLLGNSNCIMKTSRPALVVSSTSWTEDEDFSYLFDALKEYDAECCKTKNKYPDIMCVITGKGPLKEYYIELIEQQHWKHVTVITPWLEIEHYPKMLGCADLGISLHQSSSGLDLPMKIVDMFGCLLPVCALSFNCINELVRHEENGFTFENSSELLFHLHKFFRGFPSSEEYKKLNFKLKRNIKQFQEERWHSLWKKNVLPIFSSNTKSLYTTKNQ